MNLCIILMIFCASYAVDTSTYCFKPIVSSIMLIDKLYCGSDSDVEKLKCDEVTNKCMGTQGYTKCTSETCATGFRCNEASVCDACPLGCSSCSNATTCTGCLSGFFLQNKACVPLTVKNCAEGTAIGCSICKPGYYKGKSGCEACPLGCASCSAANSCDAKGCGVGLYWDAYTKICTAGIANCLEHNGARECKTCDFGYYRVTNANGVVECKEGPKNCYFVSPSGSCKTCYENYYFQDSDTGGSCRPMLVNNCIETYNGRDCKQCKVGTFLESSCSDLIPHCLVALSATVCKTCKDGYFNDKGSCSACYDQTRCKSCTSGKMADCTECLTGYVKIADYSCKPCATGCATCDDDTETKCKTCKTGYYQEIIAGAVGYIRCKTFTEGCTAVDMSGKCVACNYDTGHMLYAPTNKCVRAFDPYYGFTCAAIDENGCIAANAGYKIISGIATIIPGCCVYSPTMCVAACLRSILYNGKTIYTGNGCTLIDFGTGSCTDAPSPNKIYVGKQLWKCTDSATPCDSCTAAAGCTYFIPPSDAWPILITPTVTIYVSIETEPGACKTVDVITSKCLVASPGYILVGTAGSIAIRSPNSDPNCFTYDAANKCIQCKMAFFADSNGLCMPCALPGAKCLTCSSMLGCTAAGQGSYVDLFTLQATKCTDENCASCNMMTGSPCITCKGGYPASATGIACEMVGPTNCNDNQAIFGLTHRECTKCNVGFYLPMAQPGVNANQPCIPCPSGCATCTATFPTQCLTCLNGLSFDDSTKSCGIYCPLNCAKCSSDLVCKQCIPNFSLKDNNCVKCTTNCKSCSGTAVADCTECDEGYYLGDSNVCTKCDGTNVASCDKKPVSAENKMIATATTITKTCVAGSYRSDACTGNQAGCVSTTSSQSCGVGGCTSGYLLDTTFQCVPCDIAGCLECPKTKECTICKDGYFRETFSGRIECKLCHPECIKCSGAATTCTACAVGKKLSNGNCVYCDEISGYDDCFCGEGKFWEGSSKSCADCAEGCKTCSGKDTCLVCKNGYYLEGTTCKAALDSKCLIPLPSSICRYCKPRFYYDSITNECKNCTALFPDCLICKEAYCITCKTGYYYDPTAKKCVLCSGKLDNCDTCSKKTLCDQCKAGYYWNVTGSVCTPCMPGCKICAEATTCSACLPGFLRNSTLGCEFCTEGCKTCLNTTSCTVCRDGFYLYGANATCSPCDGICKNCIGPTDSNCSECINNATLVLNNTCKCNTGFIYDSTTKKCILGSTSSSAVYMFTGLLTLLVLLLAVF